MYTHASTVGSLGRDAGSRRAHVLPYVLIALLACWQSPDQAAACGPCFGYFCGECADCDPVEERCIPNHHSCCPCSYWGTYRYVDICVWPDLTWLGDVVRVHVVGSSAAPAVCYQLELFYDSRFVENDIACPLEYPQEIIQPTLPSYQSCAGYSMPLPSDPSKGWLALPGSHDFYVQPMRPRFQLARLEASPYNPYTTASRYFAVADLDLRGPYTLDPTCHPGSPCGCSSGNDLERCEHPDDYPCQPGDPAIFYIGVNDDFDEGKETEDAEDVSILDNTSQPALNDLAQMCWTMGTATVYEAYWSGTYDVMCGDSFEERVSAKMTVSPGEIVRLWVWHNSQYEQLLLGQNIIPGYGTDSSFYAEGLKPGTVTIQLEGKIDNDDSRRRIDKIRLSAVKIDVDVDSDNTNTTAPFGPDAPPATPPAANVEDRIEQKAGEPGRFVLVNDDDDDQDGILDYDDGYNKDENPIFLGDDVTYEEDDFVMLKVKIAPTSINLDPNQAWVLIDYSADSPDPNVWSIGRIRLWKKPGDEPRDRRSALTTGQGDWIEPGLYTDLKTLMPWDPNLQPDPGNPPASHEMTFYIEGVNASGSLGDTDITFRIDPDGPGPAGCVHADTAQVTVVRPNLGADSNNDGFYNGADEIIEDRSDLSGLYVGMNDNFDEEDDLEDFETPQASKKPCPAGQYAVVPTNDLEPVYVSLVPGGDSFYGECDLYLKGGRDHLRVYAIRWGSCDAACPATGENVCWKLIDENYDLAANYLHSQGPIYGWALYVEGILPGEAQMLLEFWHDGHKLYEDWVNFTVVQIDVDVDSDNTNTNAPYGPDAADPMTEDRIEEKNGEPGRYVLVNDDDDNKNGKLDNSVLEVGPIQDEDDLVEIKFTAPDFTPHNPDYVKWLLNVPANIDIWQNKNKSGFHVWGGDVAEIPWTDHALPQTWYMQGLEVPSSGPVEIEASLWIDPDEDGPKSYRLVHRDTVQVTVIRVGLDVDTDRDGTVNHLLDESRKDEITRDRGALFMTNYDDDDANGHPDAVSFNNEGQPIDENTDIEPGDVPDIGHLVVRAPGFATTGLQFFLRMDADDLKAVHIFEERAEGKHVLKTSSGADWPGWTAQSSASGDASLDITALVNPTLDVDLGIEALFLRGHKTRSPSYEFDGRVKVELVVQLTTGATTINPAKILKVDTVQLAVAPYLLLPNTQACQEVWLHTWTEANPIATALGALAHRVSSGGGQWLQDHVQVGMTSIPGLQMHVTMRMPYYRGQPGWPASSLLGPQRGVYRFRNTCTHDGADSGDFGGNLEIIPYSDDWPLGRIIVGNTMSTRLRSFLQAQRIAGSTAIQEPIVADTSWLAVGHIDEIMCAVPGGARGYKIVMASPDYAHQLLTTGDSARGIAAPSEDAAVFATGAQASGTASNAITTTSMVWLFDGAAHGRVQCVASGDISDGETVTLSDGTTTKVFEFDKAGDGVDTGHVQVDIVSAGTAADVRDALQSTIAAAGMGVTPYADGSDALIVINNALGTAGNVPITDTVTASAFSVQGMAGGEASASGRDFRGSGWEWVRLFSGTGAGQVGHVSGQGIGWISVAQVFNTTSQIASATGIYGLTFGSAHLAHQPSGWFTEPGSGTRYLIVTNSKNWTGYDGTSEIDFPAAMAVYEVLHDTDLWSLNTAAQGRIEGVRAQIQTSMGSGYLLHDTTTADDSLSGDSDDDFIALPTIFFGPSGTLAARHNAAFTPGLANGLAATGSLIVYPQQFGARSGAVDVFEAATTAIMGSGMTHFADDWDGYHRLEGEVHCASGEVRTLFSFNWWEHQP
ncbi:MAG TPA: protein-arginine deiminase family protein [Phycisphaerae bacterium]|nr:protein-arginine deiminase family protein [Phycisphaerae bacterium]